MSTIFRILVINCKLNEKKLLNEKYSRLSFFPFLIVLRLKDPVNNYTSVMSGQWMDRPKRPHPNLPQVKQRSEITDGRTSRFKNYQMENLPDGRPCRWKEILPDGRVFRLKDYQIERQLDGRSDGSITRWKDWQMEWLPGRRLLDGRIPEGTTTRWKDCQMSALLDGKFNR